MLLCIEWALVTEEPQMLDSILFSKLFQRAVCTIDKNKKDILDLIAVIGTITFKGTFKYIPIVYRYYRSIENNVLLLGNNILYGLYHRFGPGQL